MTKPSCSSVRFNLGDLLGRPNRNRENENEGNNGGRVDAGSILGGLLGAVKLFKPFNKDASVEQNLFCEINKLVFSKKGFAAVKTFE